MRTLEVRENCRKLREYTYKISCISAANKTTVQKLVQN